jgi:GAG-pre-integrase domain
MTYKVLEKPISIHLGDSSVIKAIGIGSLQYMMDTPNAIVPAAIPDTLHVPELAATLLSVSRFTDHKHTLAFKGSDCYVHAPTGRCVANTIKTSSGLYRLLARPTVSQEYTNITHTSRKLDINVLHHRLGHLGHDNVKRLIAKGMAEDVESVGGRIDFCEACIHGKQHRFPFPPS